MPETKMKKKAELKVIGWREWVSLPDLNIKKIKAKIDTGARTSSLHALDMHFYKRGKNKFVKFKVHPHQRSEQGKKICKTKVLEYRKVKSSNGQSELRPVILTSIQFLDEIWDVELTLTNRDEMGFRMLIGREGIRKKFLVDANKSFYGTKKRKK